MFKQITKRQFIAAGFSALAGHFLSRSLYAHASTNSRSSQGKTLQGQLSGKRITLPDVNRAPMPEIAPPGLIYNGKAVSNFRISGNPGLPDVRSFRRKLGLLIPATNTSMEHELWSLILENPGLRGVGLHTSNVITPKPQLKTEADLLAYKSQFISGLATAIDQSLLAQPEYLIMGMSLEHILFGLKEIEPVMKEAQSRSGLSWSTWHEAAPVALKKFGAKRIGLLTPFDKKGNENAIQMFKDLGFDVVASFGFSCANALHIAHVPDSAKERAITEYLATKENRLDAVVQCGTNMSLIQVSEKLEPRIGIPILGINAVLLWHALRETGIVDRMNGGGRLLREF